ncbi:MAG: hypothetical protein O3A13_10515 [Proteobacteria bacterium]|nr:hypothetical protein [Pseudomonadota bacterium]
MDNELRRYLDFAEKEEIMDGYRTGAAQDYRTRALAVEVQTAIERHNPILGIQQLIGFQILSQGMLLQSLQGLMASVRIILIVNSALIALVAWLLYIK